MEPEAEIIRAQLFALRDEAYRTFHSALMPTVPPETVIGVRVPALRKLAKQLAGTAQAEVFLQALPHGYYEENNLHAFLIELIRDYDRALAETEAFLPYINNWATCDCFCPKVFAKHKKELLVPIRRWLDSGEVYTVRYGMEMLMRYYLDDAFRPECIIQIIAHQHLHTIAHGVHLARIQPAANGHQQFLLVLCKHFGTEAVAGGPVVDVGQERFRFSQRPVVVPDELDQERVEVVLFVVSMRQGL